MMKLFNNIVFAVLSVIPLAQSVLAEIEPYACRSGAFSSYEGIQLGFVRSGVSGRSYFYDDGKNCPYNESCKKKSYLVPGNELLIAHSEDGWSCVWYQGTKREFGGWMKSDNLGLSILNKKYSNIDWIGMWEYIDSESSIVITQGSNMELDVVGDASYSGGYSGVTKTGSFIEKGVPDGEYLSLKSAGYDCEVSLQLIRDYMVVEESRCGGLNISFDGIYHRK